MLPPVVYPFSTGSKGYYHLLWHPNKFKVSWWTSRAKRWTLEQPHRCVSKWDLPETITIPSTLALEGKASYWGPASWQVRTVRIRGGTNSWHLRARIGQTIPHHDSIQVEGTWHFFASIVTGKLTKSLSINWDGSETLRKEITHMFFCLRSWLQTCVGFVSFQRHFFFWHTSK